MVAVFLRRYATLVNVLMDLVLDVTGPLPGHYCVTLVQMKSTVQGDSIHIKCFSFKYRTGQNQKHCVGIDLDLNSTN